MLWASIYRIYHSWAKIVGVKLFWPNWNQNSSKCIMNYLTSCPSLTSFLCCSCVMWHQYKLHLLMKHGTSVHLLTGIVLICCSICDLPQTFLVSFHFWGEQMQINNRIPLLPRKIISFSNMEWLSGGFFSVMPLDSIVSDLYFTILMFLQWNF